MFNLGGNLRDIYPFDNYNLSNSNTSSICLTGIFKKMEGGSNAWIVIYICFVDITYYKQEYIRKSWGKYQSGMIILSTWEVKKCGVWVRFCIIFKPQNGCGWSGWDLVLQNGWDNRDIYIYIWLVSIIRNINWCSRLHK